MKKIIFAFIVTLTIGSCDKNYLNTESFDSLHPILELINVSTLEVNASNGRIMDSDVNELKKIHIKFEEKEYITKIAFLDSKNKKTRIAVFGNDDVVYSYVDVFLDNLGKHHAKYYSQDGQLYMEAECRSGFY